MGCRFYPGILPLDCMKCTFCLLFHLLTTLAKLIRPGGSRAVIAENLLLRQQLIIHSRGRQRAPNLRSRPARILVPLSKSQAYCSTVHHCQTLDPAEVPCRVNKTQVSLSLFSSWWKEAWSQGTTQRGDQCDR